MGVLLVTRSEGKSVLVDRPPKKRGRGGNASGVYYE